MASVRRKPDEHGNLLIPRAALGDAPPDVVYALEREGDAIRLLSAPRKLFDNEDPEQRVRAFDEFMKGLRRRVEHLLTVSVPDFRRFGAPGLHASGVIA